MIDGGSALNSTMEELVIQLINENVEAGIKLGDKRHPIVQLERFPHGEAIRGVAGGVSVPLTGAVVVNVTMIECGKKSGPVVQIRYKMCAKGSTDWVG